MTLEELREIPGFTQAFSACWPGLRAFLTAKTLKGAAGAKCVADTAQAESATTKALSQLISELATVAMPALPQQPTPRMTPLNSMTETETEA